MNDLTDNPFDLPDIDKKDIPVLDDIVAHGSIHENRTPIIPEQTPFGPANYNFDTHAISVDKKYFTEDLTPEEISKELLEEDISEMHDTEFAIEDRNNGGINETSINIANELHIDRVQLTKLIEQITIEVQHKLEPVIEAATRQSMEDNLNNILYQHKNLIKESIHTQLMEQLPGILNNLAAKPVN